ncbi:MAG: hypothetical protein JXB85_14120 [Anaerolineales bacterium]|nr:hypothetical protein [Anaerolineales bacterium]
MKRWIPWLHLAIGLMPAAHRIEKQQSGCTGFYSPTAAVLPERTGFIPVYILGADGLAAAKKAFVTHLLFFAPAVSLRRCWALKVGLVERRASNGPTACTLSPWRPFPGGTASLGLLASSVFNLTGMLLRKEAST